MQIKGGEDAYGVLSLYVISRKSSLQLVALLLKKTYNLRHPMHPRHSVSLSPNTTLHLQAKTRIPQPHTRQYTLILYNIFCICFKCY